MAEFPALPLWTDAYLADTADLSDSEHGLYLLMLMISWRRPDCALPNDMDWLRRVLNAHCGGHLHGNRFNATVPDLLQRFFELDVDGKFHQKRLRKERDFVEKRSRKQSENAQKRWSATSENNELANASAMPPGNAPTPTPTPTLSKKDNNLTFNGNGSGKSGKKNGQYNDPNEVTLEDPDARIVKFQQNIAAVMGPDAWDVIRAATDDQHPYHRESIKACKIAARRIEKGWPHNWPTKPDIYDRLVNQKPPP